MKKEKVFVSATQETVNAIEMITGALESAENIIEEDLEKRKFPLRYCESDKRYRWDPDEIREFFEDPENVRRTVFCPKINEDMLDDWGIFGYGPGFIYIEELRYTGSRSLSDAGSLVGYQFSRNEETGLSYISHYDFFPRRKFGHQYIRESEYRELYDLMKNIFAEKIERSKVKKIDEK